MGEIYYERVTDAQLDTCDQCNNKGLKTSGREIQDEHGEVVMWICFNCKVRAELGL